MIGIGLWAWFANNSHPFFKRLFELLSSVVIRHLAMLFSVVKPVYVLLTTFLSVTAIAFNILYDSLSSLNMAELEKPVATMIHYYAFMDRFIPISEAFAGAVLCFNVWAVVIIVRWVKSFIPTISN